MGQVRSRRSVRSASVAVVAALVFAACGSDATPDDATADDAAPTAGDGSVEVPVDEPATTAESEFSLPPNVWPAEVDPVEADGADTGAEEVAKDVVTRSVDAVGDGVQPEGFDTVSARVTASDGSVCEVCLWLADDSESRRRGLMGVTDLGDAVGMAFVWDGSNDGAFVMIDTPTPLSIAWFAADGSYVSGTDMEPCLVEDTASCARYSADAPYSLAIEMFDGQLGAVGIGPGSTVELLDLPC